MAYASAWAGSFGLGSLSNSWIPKRICLIVIAGRQSFSSSNNDKQTVPLWTKQIVIFFFFFFFKSKNVPDKYLDEIMAVQIYISVVLMDNHLWKPSLNKIKQSISMKWRKISSYSIWKDHLPMMFHFYPEFHIPNSTNSKFHQHFSKVSKISTIKDK